MKKGICASLLIAMIYSGTSLASETPYLTKMAETPKKETTVIAHSGRTNKDGCHNDKKKGEYHCH